MFSTCRYRWRVCGVPPTGVVPGRKSRGRPVIGQHTEDTGRRGVRPRATGVKNTYVAVAHWSLRHKVSL